MGGAAGCEAAAVVIITLLAILGNAVVVVTLLRRSLLHHPSNRLVLSLTASNLVLALVVLPGMVASLVLGSTSPALMSLPTHLHSNNRHHHDNSTNTNNDTFTVLPGDIAVNISGAFINFPVIFENVPASTAKVPPVVNVSGANAIHFPGANDNANVPDASAIHFPDANNNVPATTTKVPVTIVNLPASTLSIGALGNNHDIAGTRNDIAITPGTIESLGVVRRSNAEITLNTRPPATIVTPPGSTGIRKSRTTTAGVLRYQEIREGRSNANAKVIRETEAKPKDYRKEDRTNDHSGTGHEERRGRSERNERRRRSERNEDGHDERRGRSERNEDDNGERRGRSERNQDAAGESERKDTSEEDNKEGGDDARRDEAIERGDEEEPDNAEETSQGADQADNHPGQQGGPGTSTIEWRIDQHRMGSSRLCQGAAFFTNFVTSASAITVAVIALDRYLAIVRPMVYGLMVTGNRCLVMLAWCWIQAALTALPPLLGWSKYEYRGPDGRCGVAWGSSPSYTAVWALSVFLVPVIIMLVSYYFILQVARNKCRRIHVGRVLGASASSPPITPDPSSSMCLDGPTLTDLTQTTSNLVHTHRDLLQTPRDPLQTSSNLIHVPRDMQTSSNFIHSPRDLIHTPRDFTLTSSSLVQMTTDLTHASADLTPTPSENPPIFPLVANGLPLSSRYAQLGNGIGNGMGNGHESGANTESKYSLRSVLGSDSRNGLRNLLGNGASTGSIVGNGKLGGNTLCPPPMLESRSRSITGMNKMTETNRPYCAPKKKLADFGRSLSFSQQQTQCVRPCLRRAQSSLSVRPTTIRKKFSLASRKPSWSWEASPAKGFRTVCVVVGTHVVTWAPYTALAVVEAILGPQRADLIPQWASVTSTLLLFTASIFYPIVYGLYNRSIRKEVMACVCPGSSRDRRRGSCHRRASTLHSNTGSVLDFSSLRHRDDDQLRHQESVSALGILGNPGQIKTISGALASPALPALPPLLQMAEYAGLSTRGYDLNARKPSQDSGAVMSSVDDPDSDMEMPTLIPQHYHYHHHHQPGRRVSAPSILDTVSEHPIVTETMFHADSSISSDSRHSRSRSPFAQQRKLPIMPLSPHLLGAVRRKASVQRSRSLEKLPQEKGRTETDSLVVSKAAMQSLRKKYPQVHRDTGSGHLGCERIQRRKGSVSILKVVAIPEDSGVAGEAGEVSDSGRGSMDSGGDIGGKSRAHQQISIDEGIGSECLVEEDAVSQV